MDSDIRFIANLFNVTGIGIVLVVSLVIGRAYQAQFFRTWKYAYLGNFLLIGLELLSPKLGRPLPISVLEAVILSSSAWLFTQTGYILRLSRLPAWSYWVTTLGCGSLTGFLLLSGTPFTLAAAVPLLLLTLAYFALGGWLVMRSLRSSAERHLSFGWLVILNGLLPLTFPLLERTAHDWIGYWTAGVSHLLVGIGMIVTLLEDSKREIQRKNEELQQLDRLKNEFISTVSHELRTPLTAIKGATWVLGQDHLTPQQVQMVTMVANQTDRLGRLISDVLDYSKLESGSLTFQFEPGDVRDLVKDAVAGYAQIFASRGVSWSLELGSEPLPADFDPDRLTQVIVNLLSNALKFTPKGGQVTCTASREGDAIQLAVQDTGTGIPPEELERIFTRFYQVNGGNSRPAEGSGLGLAICRAIVEEGHRGRIWAESRVGAGSAFYVTIPARRVTAPLATV